MKDFISNEIVPTDKIKKERGLHLAGIANALTCLGSIEEAEMMWKQSWIWIRHCNGCRKILRKNKE